MQLMMVTLHHEIAALCSQRRASGWALANTHPEIGVFQRCRSSMMSLRALARQSPAVRSNATNDGHSAS
jgi:hypothetical protein